MVVIGDIGSVEADVQRNFALRLGSFFALADQTHALLERSLELVAGYPQADENTVAPAKVCIILAARLQNDLRVCSIVSSRGYGLQAMGLAASMLETAGTLFYVGRNESRAIEWAKHSDHGHSYPQTIEQRISAILDRAPQHVAETLGRQYRGAYKSICMAKHSNPRLAMEQGLRTELDDPELLDTVFAVGPDASRIGVKNAAYALFWAIDFALLGLRALLQCCSDVVLLAQISEGIDELGRQLGDLEQNLAKLMSPSPVGRPN